MRDHLVSAANQLEEPDEIWDPLECPPELRYLWKLYENVALHRQQSASGISTLVPPSELEAFLRIHGYELQLWELEVLKDLDIHSLHKKLSIEKAKAAHREAQKQAREFNEH